jgi:hypothetical protein
MTAVCGTQEYSVTATGSEPQQSTRVLGPSTQEYSVTAIGSVPQQSTRVLGPRMKCLGNWVCLGPQVMGRRHLFCWDPQRKLTSTTVPLLR